MSLRRPSVGVEFYFLSSNSNLSVLHFSHGPFYPVQWNSQSYQGTYIVSKRHNSPLHRVDQLVGVLIPLLVGRVVPLSR